MGQRSGRFFSPCCVTEDSAAQGPEFRGGEVLSIVMSESEDCTIRELSGLPRGEIRSEAAAQLSPDCVRFQGLQSPVVMPLPIPSVEHHVTLEASNALSPDRDEVVPVVSLSSHVEMIMRAKAASLEEHLAAFVDSPVQDDDRGPPCQCPEDSEWNCSSLIGELNVQAELLDPSGMFTSPRLEFAPIKLQRANVRTSIIDRV
eukprot:gnl/TRDRNA2_/TRDRNA2_52615_c0_seq1.p1 gnl/TRDRNA2_/TRDRNA2_52615_c0~~gnl/TRDRNA2_/TRDRNA2_52615_c0_seq1.p1  ORF type:complete len:202 (+),score=31.97 gnl/TRDRNA2_/TRDRNA2_52615_c0_seq1:156-761(+)